MQIIMMTANKVHQESITNETKRIMFYGNIDVPIGLPAILKLLSHLPAHIEVVVLSHCWQSPPSVLEEVLRNIPPTVKVLSPQHLRLGVTPLSIFSKVNNKIALDLSFFSVDNIAKLPRTFEAFKICGIEFSKHVVEYCNLLGTFSKLTSLTIEHSRFLTDEQLMRIFAVTTMVTHLNLPDFMLSSRGDVIWEALPRDLIELRGPNKFPDTLSPEDLIRFNPNLRTVGNELIENRLIHLNTALVNEKLAEYLIKQVMEVVEHTENAASCLVIDQFTLNYEITPGIMERLLSTLKSLDTAESLFVYGLLKEGRIPSTASQRDLTNEAVFNVSRVLNAIEYYRQALAKSVKGTRLFDACSSILSRLTPEEKNLRDTQKSLTRFQATMDELKRSRHHVFFREIDSAPSSESNKIESRQLQTYDALTFSEKDFEDYNESDTELSNIDEDLLQLLNEQYP